MALFKDVILSDLRFPFGGGMICKAAFMSTFLSLAACGGSDSGDSEDSGEDTSTPTPTSTPAPTPTPTPEPETEPEIVDITNAIFVETSGDCADYNNTYDAVVFDVQDETETAFVLDVVISNDDVACTLSSNNIPNHDFNVNGNFADVVVETPQAFTIPRNPTIAASATLLDQQSYDAVMLNGVPLDLLSAGCYQDGVNVQIGCTFGIDDWLLDPLGTGGRFGADDNNAHTQPGGIYHYHGSPNAMYDLEDDSVISPVIGFAADGFPIYGPYFLDSNTGTIRKATSSYSLRDGSRGEETNDNPGGDFDGEYIDDHEFIADSGDLDACNGMTVDGQYGYYLTDGYPWVLNCFSGTPDDSFSKFAGGGDGDLPPPPQ